VPDREVVLERKPWVVPARWEGPGGDPCVVPWEAGRELVWRVAGE